MEVLGKTLRVKDPAAAKSETLAARSEALRVKDPAMAKSETLSGDKSAAAG